MNIIKQVTEETEKRINTKLAECDEVIAGFLKKLDHKNSTFRQDLKNIMDGGKYSVEAVEKAYERKRQLTSQQMALNNFKFYNSGMFDIK